MSIQTLRPIGAGAETNIAGQYPASGEHWDKVDEATPDDAATYVRHNLTSYATDTHTLPAGEGVGDIDKVTVYVRCYGISGNYNYAKTVIRTHGTLYEGTEHNLTANWENFSTEYQLNPYTSQPWTWSEIDALEVGVALKSSSSGDFYAICTQVYVEVTYYTETPKLSSDTGSGADSSQAQASTTGADTGSGQEVSSPSAALTRAETGNGLDVLANLMATLAKAEASTGVGTSSLMASLLSDGEAGAGLETLLSRATTPVDSGSGLDKVLARLLAASQAGSGLDSIVELWKGTADKDIARSDEGSGSELVHDRLIFLPDSGTAIDAVIAHSLFAREGYGHALGFGGVNDYVNCGNDSSLRPTGAITIEAWVKVNSGEQHGGVVTYAHTGASASGWALVVAYSEWTFLLKTADGWYTARSGDAPDYDNWEYVVAIYDGANKKIFRNNVEIHNVPATGDIYYSSIQNVLIGDSNAAGKLAGSVAQVRLSNIARTEEEMTANWNGGAGRGFEKDNHTVALWRMDEGSGSAIYDEATNHNDGTIYGASWVEGFIPRLSGLDAFIALMAGLTATENGSGLEELLGRKIFLPDAGSGIDIATLFKTFLAADNGTGLETLADLLALIITSETGSGSEKLRARIMTSAGTSDMKLPTEKGKAMIPSEKVNL